MGGQGPQAHWVPSYPRLHAEGDAGDCVAGRPGGSSGKLSPFRVR